MFDFKLPDLGEGIQEGQIVNVLVNEGDPIAEYQPMLEVETDKAAVEIPSPKAGVVAKLHVKAGQIVQVGQVLISIQESGDGQTAAPAPAVATVAAAPAQRDAAPAPAAVTAVAEAPRARTGPVPAAPVVRKLARELGVDINTIPGTGPHGRVMREDVKTFALGKRPTATPSSASSSAPIEVPGAELPDFAQYGPIRREAVSQIRKTIARQMTRAWLNTPRVTHCDNADVTELEKNRKAFNAAPQTGQAKLTMTAIVAKAVAVSLRQFPMLNASFDARAAEIIYKDYVNIGIAVDTPRGLVVPVIRGVDKNPLPQVAADLIELAERTRAGKFNIADLRGATFTITNVGALGGTFTTPMVNFPETGILALGRAAWQPAVVDGQIVPRMMLALSLSFDHRVVDGADAARFVGDVINSLENPLRLISLA